jgi:hypothetical protein
VKHEHRWLRRALARAEPSFDAARARRQTSASNGLTDALHELGDRTWVLPWAISQAAHQSPECRALAQVEQSR